MYIAGGAVSTYQLVGLVKVHLVIERVGSHMEAIGDNARQSTIIQNNLSRS